MCIVYYVLTSQAHGGRALRRLPVAPADQTLIYAAIGPADRHEPQHVPLRPARHHPSVLVPRDGVRPVVGRRGRHAPQFRLSVEADSRGRGTDLRTHEQKSRRIIVRVLSQRLLERYYLFSACAVHARHENSISDCVLKIRAYVLFDFYCSAPRPGPRHFVVLATCTGFFSGKES